MAAPVADLVDGCSVAPLLDLAVEMIMEEPWLTLLGTFLGALLGVFSGLAVNHAWSKRADNARRTQLKAVIRRAVDHNAGLVSTIEEMFGKGLAPTFNVDLPLLESTAS